MTAKEEALAGRLAGARLAMPRRVLVGCVYASLRSRVHGSELSSARLRVVRLASTRLTTPRLASSRYATHRVLNLEEHGKATSLFDPVIELLVVFDRCPLIRHGNAIAALFVKGFFSNLSSFDKPRCIRRNARR